MGDISTLEVYFINERGVRAHRLECGVRSKIDSKRALHISLEAKHVAEIYSFLFQRNENDGLA